MNKRITSAILSAALLVGLTGCRPAEPEAAQAPTEVIRETQTPQTVPETTAPAAPVMDAAQAARMAAYQAVLTRFYSEKIAPDNQDLGYDPNFGDMQSNEFAIGNVDGEPGDELIISFTTAATAGMCAWICGYDEEMGTVYVEDALFPAIVFHSGGLLEAQWSHNQGLAGDALWPYTLMGFNPASRCYEAIAHVDAWDRSLSERDYEGHTFPQELDKDGTGVLYLVDAMGESLTLSRSDYESWREDTFGSAREIELEYRKLTEENIQSLMA